MPNHHNNSCQLSSQSLLFAVLRKPSASGLRDEVSLLVELPGSEQLTLVSMYRSIPVEDVPSATVLSPV
jgi:hypothetical protein